MVVNGWMERFRRRVDIARISIDGYSIETCNALETRRLQSCMSHPDFETVEDDCCACELYMVVAL